MAKKRLSINSQRHKIINLALGKKFDVERSMNLLKQSLEMLYTGVVLLFFMELFLYSVCVPNIHLTLQTKVSVIII